MLQKISSVFVVYRCKTLTGSPDPVHAIGTDKPCRGLPLGRSGPASRGICLQGVCLTGEGELDRPPSLQDTVNKRLVRILLECFFLNTHTHLLAGSKSCQCYELTKRYSTLVFMLASPLTTPVNSWSVHCKCALIQKQDMKYLSPFFM